MTPTNTSAFPKFHFEPRSEEIAVLTIERSEPLLGLQRLTPYQYTFGAQGRPAYRIILPDTPVDDRLDVQRLTAEPPMDDPSGDLGDATDSYRLWSAGSSVTGVGVLPLLPAGQYYLVRTRLVPHAKERITMGNELVECPPNVLTLLESEKLYSYIFGPSVSAPPALTEPLLGIPFLNYIGVADTYGVIFFSFSSGSPAAAATRFKDLVLVIPISDGLILNHKVLWPAETLNHDLQQWESSGLNAFTRALISNLPSGTNS